MALPNGKHVELIDLTPPDEFELQYRLAMARFDAFWQRAEADKHEMARNWFAAAFHLGKVAVVPSPDHDQTEVWERFLAAWKQIEDKAAAKRLLGSLAQQAPAQSWVNVALIQLALQDEQGYRETCQKLHVRGKVASRGLLHASGIMAQVPTGLGFLPGVGTASAWMLAQEAAEEDSCICADGLVNTAALCPNSGLDPKDLVALIEPVAKKKPLKWEYQESLGTALYRAGKYQDAVDRLAIAVKVQGKGGTREMHCFLAMAYHKLGKVADAEAALKIVPVEGPKWYDQLFRERLLAEAEALILGAGVKRANPQEKGK